MRYGAFLSVLGAALAAPVFSAHAGEAPRRVVSINVCTDQLAMLLAAEGQLYSVSNLADDLDSSAMVDEARRYRINHGLAEEVFLMKPDLVLAGTYTTRATVDLLRRLGFRVEQFEPTNSLEDVRGDITRIGALLGREKEAADMLRRFDAEVTALTARPATGKTALSYSSNSYTTGAGTLTDSVIEAAGLRNMATEKGIVGGARVPLEMLVAGRPDLIVTGVTSYDRPALAQENFVHPAFRALAETSTVVTVPDGYWVCGTPFTVEAVRILRDAAEKHGGAQ